MMLLRTSLSINLLLFYSYILVIKYTSGIPRSKVTNFLLFLLPQIVKLILAGNRVSELNELKLLSSGADFLEEK